MKRTKTPNMVRRAATRLRASFETPTNQTNDPGYSELARIAFASRNNGSILVVLSPGQNCEPCSFRAECPAYQTKEELSKLVRGLGEGATRATTVQLAAARAHGLTKDTLSGRIPDESVVTVQRILDACGMQEWTDETPKVFRQPHGIDATYAVKDAIVEVGSTR